MNTNEINRLLDELGDEGQADLINLLFRRNLGPKALDAQTAILPACAREYVVLNEQNNVLLFKRGPGVRYPFTNHISGTTVTEKRAGKPVWNSVMEKYGIDKCQLSAPRFLDFTLITQGPGDDQCIFGEVWTQINVVRYTGGAIPGNAAWYLLDDLPQDIIPYHRTKLIARVKQFLNFRVG